MYTDMAFEQVREELKMATIKFGSFASPHEGLSIILEEFEELKQEVFKNTDSHNIQAMRKEAVQVAAMALRFIVDVT